MPWARIDDGFLGHRKAERITNRALGFWTRGLLYTARNLTDGKLPKSFVRTKTDMGLTDELLRRGLWEKTHDGYLIHDYLAWNPSKAEVEKSRTQSKDRYQKWLEKQRSNAVQTPFKQEIGKKGMVGTEGSSSLPSPNGEIQFPQPDIPLEIRAENIRRIAEMAREAAAKMAMPK